MKDDEVIIDRKKLEELELLAETVIENYPYLECEFHQYSMFKYWVPKKGVTESEVVIGLREEIDSLQKEKSKITFAKNKLDSELYSIKESWWYKLFS